ncbi:hypothetical protein DIPPA_23348 [Diplonema papillatum]|nr:hypothetical protein DIPPA_23348 [Diplonema papillatum]
MTEKELVARLRAHAAKCENFLQQARLLDAMRVPLLQAIADACEACSDLCESADWRQRRVAVNMQLKLVFDDDATSPQ